MPRLPSGSWHSLAAASPRPAASSPLPRRCRARGLCPCSATASPAGIAAAPHSVGRWARAGDGRGGQGMGASVGSSAWVCPFKWSCLLSGFGTQPLSCLRLQRQRIKGLFYLNETLSPASRWMVDSRVLNARVPVDSGVLDSCWGGSTGLVRGAGGRRVLRGWRCPAKGGAVGALVGWCLDVG